MELGLFGLNKITGPEALGDLAVYAEWSHVDAHPRPLRPQGPPILVGGHGPAAYRRAATAGDSWYGPLVDPAGVREALA